MASTARETPFGCDVDSLRRQYDEGLDQYLNAKGSKRQQLTIELLRLKWAEEDVRKGANKGGNAG